MKVGDLVKIWVGDFNVGIYLKIDPEYKQRSLVLHGEDGLVYSVPTFQLEVVNEGG